MKVSKVSVTLTIPGQIINVDNNKVTVELPCIEGPILTQEARRVLVDGLSDIDADVMVEKVEHYAMSESIRAHMKIGTMVQHVTQPIAAAPAYARA